MTIETIRSIVSVICASVVALVSGGNVLADEIPEGGQALNTEPNVNCGW
jgi:hypothetical protein